MQSVIDALRADLAKVTEERDDAQSVLASVTDAINVICRDYGAEEVTDYLTLAVRDGLERAHFATVKRLKDRAEKAEAERLRQNSYPHMCRKDHQQIGHSDSEDELCPVCRERETGWAEAERLREVVRKFVELDWRNAIRAFEFAEFQRFEAWLKRAEAALGEEERDAE